MNHDHISFQQLSDLYDNEIATASERDALLKHIGECPDCAREYQHLGKTLHYCREFSHCCFKTGDLPGDTIRKIGTRHRRKRILQSIPAMAASILVIVGVSMLNTDVIKTSGTMKVAERTFNQSTSDTEQVIEIIRKNNATITQVTDQFVEGTVTLAQFKGLQKRLGFRKVAYMPMEDIDSLAGVHWNNAIENVGHDDGQAGSDWEPISRDSGVSKQFIVFRVYR